MPPGLYGWRCFICKTWGEPVWEKEEIIGCPKCVDFKKYENTDTKLYIGFPSLPKIVRDNF